MDSQAEQVSRYIDEQEELTTRRRWEEDYLKGFNKCMDDWMIDECTSDGERAGWLAAFRTGWTMYASSATLNLMGV